MLFLTASFGSRRPRNRTWLGNVSHRLTRIDKIVASWLTKINTYTYLTKARALDKARECVRMGAAGERTRRSLGHNLLHPQNFDQSIFIKIFLFANTYTYLTKARALDKALIKSHEKRRTLIKYLSLRSWTIIRLVRNIKRQFHPNFKNL